MVKAVVYGRKHNRREKGRIVRYQPGDTCEVSERELKAFRDRLRALRPAAAASTASADDASPNRVKGASGGEGGTARDPDGAGTADSRAAGGGASPQGGGGEGGEGGGAGEGQGGGEGPAPKFDELTKAQLTKMAEDFGIEIRANANKAELIEALDKAFNDAGE